MSLTLKLKYVGEKPFILNNSGSFGYEWQFAL